MVTRLFHGAGSAKKVDAILEEGVQGPSYWGTADEAALYATPDGLVFRMPIEEFDLEDLVFNDLVAGAMADNGEDVPLEGSWRASLEAFGSVRYEGVILPRGEHLVPVADYLPDRKGPAGP